MAYVADWDAPSEFLYYIPERLLSLLSLSDSKELLEAKSTVEGIRPYARIISLCNMLNESIIRKEVVEVALTQGLNDVVPIASYLSKEDLCDLFFLLSSCSLSVVPTENSCKFLTINNCNTSYNIRKNILSYDNLVVLSRSPFTELLQLSGLKTSKVELDKNALLDGRDVIKGDTFAIVGLSNDTNIYGSQALAHALSLDFFIVVLAPQRRPRAFLKLISRDLALADVQELKRSTSMTLKLSENGSVATATRSNLYDELRSLKFELLDLRGVDLRSVIKVSERTILAGSGNDSETLKMLKDTGYDVILSRNKIIEDYLILKFSK